VGYPTKPCFHVGDITRGHGGFPISVGITGSARTLADGRRIMRRLDLYTPHTACFDEGEEGGDDDNWLPFTEGEDDGPVPPTQLIPYNAESTSKKEEGDLTSRGVIIDLEDRDVSFNTSQGGSTIQKNVFTVLSYDNGELVEDFNNDTLEFTTDQIILPPLTEDGWSFGLTDEEGHITNGLFGTFANDIFPETLTEAYSVGINQGAGYYGRVEHITTKTVVDGDVLVFAGFYAANEVASIGLGATTKLMITKSDDAFVNPAGTFAHFTIGHNVDGSILATASPGAEHPNNAVSIAAIDVGPSLTGGDPGTNWVKFEARVTLAEGTATTGLSDSTIKVVLAPPVVGAFVSYTGLTGVANPDDSTGEGEGGVTIVTSIDPEGPAEGEAELDPDPGGLGESGEPTDIIYGCIDPIANNTTPGANVDDGSCEYDPIYGCTNPEAANYDGPFPPGPEVTDDGSCILVFQGDGPGSGGAETQYPGCTDPVALNFNEDANIDDGSCRYVTIVGPIDGEPTGGQSQAPGDSAGTTTTFDVDDLQTGQTYSGESGGGIILIPQGGMDGAPYGGGGDGGGGGIIFPPYPGDVGEGTDIDIDDPPIEEEDGDGEVCITHNPFALTGAPRVLVEGRPLHRGGNAGVFPDLISCGDLPGITATRVHVGN